MISEMLGTVRRTGGCFGSDPSTISALWRSSILNVHRFRDDASRVLARHEEVDAESMFYPDDDLLAKLGINLDTLATALDAGTINAERVHDLVADLATSRISAEQFDDTVGLTLLPDSSSSLPADDRLTAAAHYPDVLEAARIHPDDHLERALHGSGHCSCNVEYAAA